MPKPKSRNLVIRTSDGKIVVATAKALAFTRSSVLSAELLALLQARQQAGKDVTDALKEEGFDVVAGEETDVSDAGGEGDGNKGGAKPGDDNNGDDGNDDDGKGARKRRGGKKPGGKKRAAKKA